MEFLAFLLPAAIDLFNRKIQNSDVRFWVSALICAVAGIGLNFLDTNFVFASAKEGFSSLSASIMAAFGMAQISYKAIWEKSDIRENLNLDASKN